MPEPITLPEIRWVVLARVRPDLLDAHRTWKYLPLLRLRTAQWGCCEFGRKDWGYLLPSQRFDRNLLRHAQDFLAPLAENTGCRTVRRGNRWTNPGYCPPTPFGEYHWPFTVWMVQEILWYESEFVYGFKSGLSPGPKGRDENPYHPGDRRRSWDQGYILGLAVQHDSRSIITWLSAMRAAETEAETETEAEGDDA